MYFETLHRVRRSIALRLTIWYAAIFAASSLLAFAFVYAQIAVVVADRTSDELREDVAEYTMHWRQEGIERVTKELLRRVRLDGPTAKDDDMVALAYGSADFREGLESFLAKRPPHWKGR